MSMILKNVVRFIRTLWIRVRSCTISVEFTRAKRVLILAPHPDDEVMGCGGLIQRLCEQGNTPHVVILTGGGQSHAACCHLPESDIKKERRAMASQILQNLGLPADHLYLLDFPDGSISAQHKEMQTLQNLVAEIRPEVVFIPHHGEGWSDHLVCRELVEKMPALGAAVIYEYCVWLWYYNVWKLDWKRARLLRLTKSEHVDKCRAVDEYTEKQAPCGKPWSGVLPSLLIGACKWNKELYFRIR